MIYQFHIVLPEPRESQLPCGNDGLQDYSEYGDQQSDHCPRQESNWIRPAHTSFAACSMPPICRYLSTVGSSVLCLGVGWMAWSRTSAGALELSSLRRPEWLFTTEPRNRWWSDIRFAWVWSRPPIPICCWRYGCTKFQYTLLYLVHRIIVSLYYLVVFSRN
jgi:hypothetical protein